jgi:putative SOS response-associated peptidase YedK
MCGRYSLFATTEDLAARFGASFPADFEPRYNCAPGQRLPVIPGDDPNEARRMEWGFTPSWADESFDLINARAETVDDKLSFADAFERRRCLVPADGFYEWTDADGGRRPYRISYDDDRPFGMAGIYERWTPPTRQSGLGEFGVGEPVDEEESIETFAVVTTEPNEVVADLHHRMAVIVPPDRESVWLSGEVDAASDLLEPAPGDEMRAYPVATRLNDPANDDPSLIEPVAGES